jgi:FkbH-like protein
MKYFIYRNATIERFFQGLDAVFSGYEDISETEETLDRYVWFYLPPVATNEVIVEKTLYYAELVKMLVVRLPKGKMIIVFTMQDMFSVQSVLSNDSVAKAIQTYNETLRDMSANHTNVKVIDFGRFLDGYKLEERLDWRYYFISQMGLNPRMATDFGQWWDAQIRAIEMKRKKCLVLDLDNTLWGGVLGEDGVSGVALGGDYPGKAFLLFQQQLFELSRQGVILAVCSKNNIEDVRELWREHPDAVLKEEHFAALRINWNNKADNIREIATELNIGLDSLVFLDDNPSERELVKHYLPEVVAPDFPAQPYLLPTFFKGLAERYFATYALTDEDRDKTAQYKANSKRAQAQQSFTDMDEYIRYLEIELTVVDVSELTLPRAAQMTQKTNQFNLTTRRYTETDLQNKLSSGSRILTLSVRDRFGDSGLTGLCIIDYHEQTAHIDALLLSCRILGKGIENKFVTNIMKQLHQQGIKEVTAEYIPTAKNRQVCDFYEKRGFTLIKEDEKKIKHYKFLKL